MTRSKTAGLGRRASCLRSLCFLFATLGLSSQLSAQLPQIRHGSDVPIEVRTLCEKGLDYLVKVQSRDGGWNTRQSGSGVTGIVVMAFLATGEDPNFGRYSSQIRRALTNIVKNQDPNTGYIGPTMYHHGFASLALTESYGVVDERGMWGKDSSSSLGRALELAVRCSITAQKKNSWGGWRYSPTSSDSDTSVAGAVLMSLLGARNAGLEVPDEVIDKAINYFVKMTSDGGMVGYHSIGGFGESTARSAIATLVYAIAKRKELDKFKAALSYTVDHMNEPKNKFGDQFYTLYYQAQALFQGDYEAWKRWNKQTIRVLRQEQADDGSFESQQGKAYGTAMAILSLALNYRFLPVYER